MTRHGPNAQVGVVLMALLLLLALLGLTVVTYAETAVAARKRALEDELLWVGVQYQHALESYYWSSPGKAKHLPVTLDELVRDTRFPQPVRHIRRLYADPLQPSMPWGLLRNGGQIIGVHSQAEGSPQRRTGFGPGNESFDGSTHYTDWRFIFFPRSGGGGPLQGTRPNPSIAPTTSNKP